MEFAVNRGLLSGISATKFRPNTAMTRGMFATALGRLAHADVSGYTQSIQFAFRKLSLCNATS
ncbi:S-layer homology domain-containing protein [Desulfitobacterium hafniense]|uniref:S-layer homology domain-containing protein n=1 Tax=Desulfitobacterium hafniense TaxID=49338 RepID=UPI0034E2A775